MAHQRPVPPPLDTQSAAAIDPNTSSEDEKVDLHSLPPEDADNVIGVSIGREQTRLLSPKTPAVEKAAAINEAGGFFGRFTDGTSDEALGQIANDVDDDDPECEAPTADAVAGAARERTAVDGQVRPATPERAPRKTPVRMPSPWSSAPREFQTGKQSGGSMRSALAAHTRRASGPESMFESWQRTFRSNLPSLPKYFHFGSAPSSNPTPDHSKAPQARGRSDAGLQGTNDSRGTDRQVPIISIDHLSEHSRSAKRSSGTAFVGDSHEDKAPIGDLPGRPELHSTRSRQSQLRRSASETSLGLHRTLSRVSSLGDDSRFDHVHEQVNSRIKAIKDSWQDSNIKLPSISGFSVSHFAPDFLRERSSSLSRKQSVKPSHPDSAPSSGRTKVVDPMTRQAYSSVGAAVSDVAGDKSASHPQLHRAMSQLEGDLVIMGGYRGSILRSADPPHRQLWVPVKVGLNLRKADLEVGLQEDADERATEKIIPDGMLSHIGPVDISRRLLKRLRASETVRSGKVRVHDYGYDWRLHPLHLSKQLISYLESLPCNKPGVAKELKGATVIAHSLGGLITRHVVNQRPDLFKAVLYAGVPRTCVNILGPLRNGDEVLLSSRVLTAQVNFTIRTSFALLPLNGRCFFDKHTKEEYPVDFFNPQTWVDYRLSPCVARPLPPLFVQPKPSGITSYMSSVASALPSLSLPGRKNSAITSNAPKLTTAAGAAAPDSGTGALKSGSAMANGNIDTSREGRDPNADASSSVRTTVTIPRDEAIEYLTRTLATVKKFKQELLFNPAHANANVYPPFAVIYGKSTPTVYGARVVGREGIKHADAYDDLAFASGDGVVLARAAMLPDGYTAAKGGVVSSERGHVTLLGDLEAVGRCLNAVIAARRRGVGCGV